MCESVSQSRFVCPSHTECLFPTWSGLEGMDDKVEMVDIVDMVVMFDQQICYQFFFGVGKKYFTNNLVFDRNFCCDQQLF